MIHLVFKTHLDLGFTNTAAAVIQQYFERDIPRAAATARELRQSGGPERFVWTTGAWLIYEYLEQASPADRKQLEDAIVAGDITWHALPFTTHTELMDTGLFRFGLSLGQELDQRFGRQTIAAKMSDVPGHTRGIVPLLAEAGIRFLHIGVNDAAALPEVPPAFRWQSPDGAEVLMMIGRGYGSAAAIPGLSDRLVLAHTIDNSGPQSADQVRAIYAKLRSEYPGEAVQASTLDHFARALLTVQDDLPVVTQEIGDTWIHGVGSDPRKVSAYRALLRLRQGWLETGVPAAQLHDFSRRLLLIPEHTWGMDEKTFLADHAAYRAAAFKAARGQPNFQTFASSWAEQRAYIDQALDALSEPALSAAAHAAVEETRPQRPVIANWQRVLHPERQETAHFVVRFDPLNGTVGLRSRAQEVDWPQGLGLFRYQTFSAADYERFAQQYLNLTPETEPWAWEDYTKPGLELAAPERRWWLPAGVEVYRKQQAGGALFLVWLNFAPRAADAYGCPRRVYLEWFFPDEAPEARLRVLWFDKSATRLPEALWLSFTPTLSETVTVQMDKLGQPVSPLDVVAGGNRKLHAVGRDVRLRDRSNWLEIDSLDAPLLAPGEPSLLNFNREQPNLRKGLHYNLYNNLWGTNFPMWSEDDGLFRFVLRMGSDGSA